MLNNNDHESQSLIMKAHAYARKQQPLVLLDQQDNNNNNNQQQENQLCDLILPDALWETQKYDCGVANILAGPLQALAPTLAQLLRPGAPLGLSGILQRQGPTVVQAYREAGFVDVQIAAQRGDWVLVTARRRSDGREE